MADRSAPDHIAIIMDGNRRWATEKGRPSQFGHQHGSDIVEAVAEAAHNQGANWLTLFAFSTENWKRSSMELTGLMTVLRHYLKNHIPRIIEKNIRLRVAGDLSRFAPDIITLVEDAVVRTRSNTGLNLTIALGYGGHADLARAARAIAEAAAAGQLDPATVDEAMVKQHLTTAELPPVDLLIRTGREQRVSNFLLWDIAYAELAFTPTLWPDFTASELALIIADYTSRSRRFGGGIAVVPAQKTSGQS